MIFHFKLINSKNNIMTFLTIILFDLNFQRIKKLKTNSYHII